MKTPKQLDLIAWNVYIGNSPAETIDDLLWFRAAYDPEIVALMEASRLYGELDDIAYKVVQLKPKAKRPGNQPGDGNVAILVRSDVEIVKRITQRMKEFWIGPVNGWNQDPRVYRWVKVRIDGKIWKIGCAHIPFGERARAESVRKLVRAFRNVLPGTPTVLVLDANMHMAEFRERISDPAGATSGGEGIDLIAYKNAKFISAKNLGHHGSDHPAMRYQLQA